MILAAVSQLEETATRHITTIEMKEEKEPRKTVNNKKNIY